MQLDTPLPTKHLQLRSLTTAEATERYLGWMRDPLTTRYLEARLTEHSLGSLRNYIDSCNAGGVDLLLGIFLIDGSHIGNIKLGPVDWYHQSASVGLLIGEKRYWGKG